MFVWRLASGGEVSDTAFDPTACLCGTMSEFHKMGEHPDCEYFEHHCEACHEKKLCTKTECLEKR